MLAVVFTHSCERYKLSNYPLKVLNEKNNSYQLLAAHIVNPSNTDVDYSRYCVLLAPVSVVKSKICFKS